GEGARRTGTRGGSRGARHGRVCDRVYARPSRAGRSAARSLAEGGRFSRAADLLQRRPNAEAEARALMHAQRRPLSTQPLLCFTINSSKMEVDLTGRSISGQFRPSSCPPPVQPPTLPSRGRGLQPRRAGMLALISGESSDSRQEAPDTSCVISVG